MKKKITCLFLLVIFTLGSTMVMQATTPVHTPVNEVIPAYVSGQVVAEVFYTASGHVVSREFSDVQNIIVEDMQSFTPEEMAAIDAGTTLEELAAMMLTLEELLAIDAEVDAIYGENFSLNQRKAMRYHELLHSVFMQARDGSTIYPSFYGGSAIDYDGTFIVFVVESALDEAYRHDSMDMIFGSDIRHRLVEFSYAELLAVHEAIACNIHLLSLSGCVYSMNVSSGGVSSRANRVIIGLIEYNEDMIAGFRKHVYDSPMLIFEQRNPIRIDDPRGEPFCLYCCDADSFFDSSDMDEISYQENAIMPLSAAFNTGIVMRRRVLTGGPVFTAQGNPLGLISGGDQNQMVFIPINRIFWYMEVSGGPSLRRY